MSLNSITQSNSQINLKSQSLSASTYVSSNLISCPTISSNQLTCPFVSCSEVFANTLLTSPQLNIGELTFVSNNVLGPYTSNTFVSGLQITIGGADYSIPLYKLP